MTATAAVFNPAMNLVLIPLAGRAVHNGAVGAAIVAVATELLILAGALRLVPAGAVTPSLAWTITRIGLAGGALAAVVVLLRLLPVPLAAGAGGVTFVGAATAFGVLSPVQLWRQRHHARQALAWRLAGRGA